jgi:hypothetical protein
MYLDERSCGKRTKPRKYLYFRVDPLLSSGETRIALDAAMRSGTCR